jgi:hypothetical protein
MTDSIALGTTQAPAFSAVCIRGAWSLGDVLSRYFKFETAQDAYLGRILAGLDVNSIQFAVLPPHFAPDTITDAQILRVFPSFHLRPEFLGVLRLILPSLVHHHAALCALLPEKHQLRLTHLFTDRDFRHSLRAKMITGLDSPHMRATGIPPHITVLRQGASMNARLDVIVAAVTGADPAPDAEAAPTAAPKTPITPASSKFVNPTPGQFPVNFELPLIGPLGAWRLLIRGCKARGLPPYRYLNPSDFPGNMKLRKRISDWKFFFNALNERLGGLSVDTLERLEDSDDESELGAYFLAAWESFGLGKGAKKTLRPDQWKLNTAILKLRQALKTPAVAAAAADAAAAEAPMPMEVEELSVPKKLFTVPRKRQLADTFVSEDDGAKSVKAQRLDGGERKPIIKKRAPVVDYSSLL